MVNHLVSGEKIDVAEEWVTLIRQLSTRELELLGDHLVKQREESGKKIEADYKKLSEEHIANMRREQSKKISDLQMRCLMFSKQIEASLSEKKRIKLTAKYLQQKDQLADLQSQILRLSATTPPSFCLDQCSSTRNPQAHPERPSDRERGFCELQQDNRDFKSALQVQREQDCSFAERIQKKERDLHQLSLSHLDPQSSCLSRSAQLGKSTKRVRFLT